jgi:tetratricopeptide (TPR) repeat protein
MQAFVQQLRDSTQAVDEEALSVNIDSIRSRASILEESKDYGGAARVWQEFIRRHPEDSEAINELGITLICGGRFEEGLDCFRQALRIRPDFVSAKTNAGVALRRLNKIQEALSQFQEVVEITPDDAIACFNLGTTLHLAEQFDGALTWLQRAVELCPSHAEGALELGKVFGKLNRNEEAIQAYRRAISLAPDCIAALLNLAVLLHETKQFEEAVTLLKKVVERHPNECDGWLRLGAALRGARRHVESLAAYRRALAINPGSALGYCNISLVLMELGRIEEAIETCKKAIFIEPSSPIANFNMGTMLLMLGNFRDGWQAYKYRYAMHGEKWLRDEAHAAPWTGEAVAGKSILILGEQGNGDHIQFARYLSALSDLGACVFYLAPKRLHRLFSTLDGSPTLLSELPKNSRFDFQCPLMHLPAVFETLGLPLPNKTRYLAAEPGRVAHWRGCIGDQGFRVGIVWQGNRYDGHDVRSYPLAALRPLATISGVRLISLQINDGSEQLENLPPDMNVERLGPDFDTGEHGFIDAAAVLEVVDLIVSCDTSIVHLAGALGRPVWIALKKIPEWRWQLNRSDSIWYPSATLFRQSARGDWDDVFSRMAKALEKLLENRTTAIGN